MNSTKKYNDQSSLSREDISTYLDSKKGSEKNTIEQKALANNFDDDALEGWNESGLSLHAMKKLDKKFTPKNNLVFSIGAGIIVAMLIVGALFYVNKDTLYNERDQKTSKKISLSVEKTDVILPVEIEKMVELKKEDNIQPKKLKETFKTKLSNTENIQTTIIHQGSEITLIDLPILKNDLGGLLEQSTSKKISTSSQAKEIYLNDLKLVDYREYRARPEVKTKSLILTGVAADLEKIENKNSSDNSEWKDVQIPYYDYIKKTQLLFSKENYKYALSRYLTILETYPDDVNALFYSGLCYYNLREYTTANQNFGLCLQSRFNNFNEEAEWFMALSYSSLGENSKAQAIYKLIMEKNGYYSAEAKKLIKR